MKRKVQYSVLIFVIFFSSQNISSQPVWDSLVLEKANSAKDTRYLKDEEKQVIFYLNLARANGKLFAESYLKWYMESTGKKPNSYTRSLERDLNHIRNLPILFPEKDLYDIARSHAVKSGKSGTKGHKGFKKRFKKLNGIYSTYGENCYYGRENPLVIVIRLLIDEEVSDLGHRFNMLDAGFNSIGVSIMPHKTYGYNCVMEFGRK